MTSNGRSMNEIDKFLHVKRLQSGTVADRTVNPLSKRQSGAVIERPTLRGTGRAVRTVEKERGSISLSGSKKKNDVVRCSDCPGR